MSDIKTFDELLTACEGVRTVTKQHTDWHGRGQTQYSHYLVGDLVVPDDIYIQVHATATKGTIGKLATIEPGIFKQTDGAERITDYDTKFTFTVEGRPKPGRIGRFYAKILPNHDGTTKWVRNVKSHPKEEIKNPVNKYKQELQKGDWVVGVLRGKKLGIGQITRWTNSSVWGRLGDGPEFIFQSINETFTMPDDEHVKLLTFAVLKGWNGR